jgi:hypothetical protein
LMRARMRSASCGERLRLPTTPRSR